MINLFKKLFKAPVKKDSENELFEWVVRDLRRSKYCELNDEEVIFIKALIQKLNQNKLTKGFKLERTSRRDIHLFYTSYPIGRIKLNGRKRWMTANTDVIQNFDNLTLEEFIGKIDIWISYIKECERS